MKASVAEAAGALQCAAAMAAVTRTHMALVWVAVAALAGTAIGVGAYRARDGGTSDFDDFWKTARYDFLEHRTMTERFGVHNYLPFFVVVMSPLGLLPLKTASIVFNTISVAAFGAAMWMTHRLLGRQGPASPWAVWLAGLLVLPYAFDCVMLGQAALFIVALLVWCLRLSERRRETSAGLVLAVAASLKLFPIVLGLYFLLKRQTRVLAGLVIGLIICNGVIPAAAFGMRRSWELHRAFWERSARGQSLLALALADSDKMRYTNQSLPLVLKRLTSPTHPGIQRDGKPRYVNITTWSQRPIRIAGISLAPVQWAAAGVAGALSFVAIVVTRRPARRTGLQRMRYEFGGFVLLSILLAPVIWTFYFSLCFLPLALVGGHVERKPNQGLGSKLVLGAFAAGAPLLALPEARAAGAHYWLSLLLMFTMWMLAVRGPERSPS